MSNESVKKDSIKDEEISLKELILKIREWWQYLWSKKWIIIIVGIIGGGLGLGYSFIKKPIYTATTTFVLEGGEKGSGLGAYAGIASMMGVDLGGGGGGIFQGDNILELYRSRKMIEKTLLTPLDSNSLIIDHYIKVNNLRKAWSEEPKLKHLNFSNQSQNADTRIRDSVIGVIVDNIKNTSLSVVRIDKKLNIIKVDVRSIDESLSKNINDYLVKNVNDFYVSTKTKKSIENVNILQHKTDSVRAVMNGAIYSAVAVADATPNANPTRQVKRVAPIQRSQFSAETNKAVLGEMLKNLEMSKLALLKETPLIQIIDQPVYPLKKDRLGKAKGIMIGGSLFGLIICVYLILRRFIQTL